MTFRLIEAERAQHTVSRLCKVLGVTRGGFYAWSSRSPSARELRDRQLLELIGRIHEDSRGTYGVPRVHAELLDEHGVRIARKRVARLMRRLGIEGVSRRGNRPVTTTPKQPAPAVDDLVRRQFRAPEPNRLWVADITYVPTREGFLFLAAVIDAFSRRCVGWSMRADLKADLVLDALGMAITQRRPAPGLIHHSDRGSQGEFNWSLQRSIGEGCDGQAQGLGVGSDGAAGDAFAGAPAGGAQGASAAVLGGGCSWVEQRGGRDRGGCVAGGRRPVVSGVWWDAACQSGAVVGALSVVRGARGDRAFARAGSGRARDRPAAWALAVDDLA
jgi:putative transposase